MPMEYYEEDEGIHFDPTTQNTEKKIGCGKYSKRNITGENNDGIDRGNGRQQEQQVEERRCSRQRKRVDHQYEASSSSEQQPIKSKKSKKDHHDEASTSSSEQQPINIEILSESLF
ncbi:hypothetical protein AXX17_AT3G40380 [Arabidopsis thaliana]|uniref:Uncharacterized protein n=1 Tax=Arabidopsis thaliana TaxID=3702 RepID=A0A178VJ34_ARATH|nr:hypothetical protein AXX17_AT3G40380 [Arabidopsis thaliana]